MKCKALQNGAAIVFACITTFALGLDMTIGLPYQLILTLQDGFFGIVDNLLITFNYFHTMDHITGAVLIAGLSYVYCRWLFRNKEQHAWGEYALSLFFALTMLVSEAVAAENSIKALWAGGTQLLKGFFYLLGMWPLFLVGLRALMTCVQKLETLPKLEKGTLWDRYPFLCPFLLMAVCWMPILIMKFPGGMSPDVTVQILDWLNQSMELSHPPFTSVAYGIFYELGEKIGCTNVGIFLFTLLQTLCFLAVLAYSCVRMRCWKVPKGVFWAVLAAYCFAPNYSGWTTTLVKDVPYLIACILLCVLLIDWSLDCKLFCKQKMNHVLLVAAGVALWLWRRNGLAMVLGCGVCMLLAALRQKDKRCVGEISISLVLTICISLGINTFLQNVFPYRSAAQRETYSHLLQVTGRVAMEYPDAYSEEELAIINEVMSYDEIPEWYSPIITDGMKALFKEDATEAEYAAFRSLVAEKMADYPVEYADAYINLIYRLFDWRSDRGDYIGRREISHPYYIRSYTNMLYDQEKLQGLNAAQEAVENWNFWFVDLPLVGLLVNIGFCVDVMIALCWIMVKKKRNIAIFAMLPAILTVIFCLFSPLVYIRYAVPITATLPLWFAAYTAHGAKQQEEV